MFRKLLLITTTLLFVFSTYGQDGSYNSNFASGGIFELLFPDENLSTGNFFEMDDQNLLLRIRGDDEYVLKLSEDGILDESFGDNGILTVNDPMLNGFLVQNDPGDQKLVIRHNVLLNGSTEVAFTRIFLDGTIDLTFGSDGSLFPFSGDNIFGAIRFLDDNSFFVSGLTLTNGEQILTIKKYLPSGSLDSTYGDNGIATAMLDVELTSINQFLLDNNGRFVLHARADTSSIANPVLVRFDVDGLVDETFGVDGIVSIPTDNGYFPSHVALFNNNEIAISLGYFDTGTEIWSTRLIKLLGDGTLDGSFGGTGEIFIENSRGKLIIQPNNRLIYLGFETDWEGGTFLEFIRYYQNGNFDSSFNFQSNFPIILGSFNARLRQNGDLTVGGATIWYEFNQQRAVMMSYNNSPLSVEENTLSELQVYPNPSDGILHVKRDPSISDLNYTVIDLSGKLLLTGNLEQDHWQLDISELSNGVYFLNVENHSIRLLKK